MNKKDRDELLVLLKDQVEFYKNQVLSLREEKETLQKQVFMLQEGLMAQRAPEAYRELQRDKVTIDPREMEAWEKQRVYAEMVPKALKTIESPLFDNVDDMIKSLGVVISEKGLASESIHGNPES